MCPRHHSACKRSNQHFFRASSCGCVENYHRGKEVTRSGEETADLVAVSIEAALVQAPCSLRRPVQFLIECRGKNESSFLPLLQQTEALTLFSPLLSLLSPLSVSSLRTLTVTDPYWIQPYLTLSLSSLLSVPSFLSYSLVNKEKIRAGTKISFFFPHRQGGRLHTSRDLLSVLIIILHVLYFGEIVFRYNSLL